MDVACLLYIYEFNVYEVSRTNPILSDIFRKKSNKIAYASQVYP